MYRFNAILIKTNARLFVDIDMIILKFMWKGKGMRLAKTIQKKNKVGRFILLNFKTYFMATVIKT